MCVYASLCASASVEIYTYICKYICKYICIYIYVNNLILVPDVLVANSYEL